MSLAVVSVSAPHQRGARHGQHQSHLAGGRRAWRRSDSDTNASCCLFGPWRGNLAGVWPEASIAGDGALRGRQAERRRHGARVEPRPSRKVADQDEGSDTPNATARQATADRGNVQHEPRYIERPSEEHRARGARSDGRHGAHQQLLRLRVIGRMNGVEATVPGGHRGALPQQLDSTVVGLDNPCSPAQSDDTRPPRRPAAPRAILQRSGLDQPMAEQHALPHASQQPFDHRPSPW